MPISSRWNVTREFRVARVPEEKDAKRCWGGGWQHGNPSAQLSIPGGIRTIRIQENRDVHHR
jgi:hypothetical protein